MSRTRFGEPHDPTTETDLKHIHVPVIVEANYFGQEPIFGAEPWVRFEDPSLGEIRLLWQNQNDAEGLKPEMTLQAGRIYQIPFVARSLTDGFPLAGQPVMSLPSDLNYNQWALQCGIPRITDGAHYFTFVGFNNLEDSETYPITLQVRTPNGRILLAEKFFLRVPYRKANHEEFLLY